MFDPTNEKARGFISDLLGGPKSPTQAEPKPGEPASPAAKPAEPQEARAELDSSKTATAAETPSASDKSGSPEPSSSAPAAPAKKERKKKEPEPIDYEKLASTTAEAATRAAVEAVKQQSPAAPVAEEVTLPASEQRRVNYLKRLEQLYPDKYADVASRYEKSYKEIEKYQRKWEQANPGETFDPEAQEHTAFFEKNAVDWEDEDYAEAVAEEKSEAVRRQTVAEYEERERRKEAAPRAQEKARSVTKDLVQELDPAFKDLDPFAPDADAKAEDLDPVKGPVIVNAARFAEQFVKTSNRLFDGVDKFDAANPLHKQISDFASQKEQAIMALPRDQQLDNQGRTFVPADRYYSLPPKERARTWTLSADDVAFRKKRSPARKPGPRNCVRSGALRGENPPRHLLPRRRFPQHQSPRNRFPRPGALIQKWRGSKATPAQNRPSDGMLSKIPCWASSS
jgi:hypothetical protein